MLLEHVYINSIFEKKNPVRFWQQKKKNKYFKKKYPVRFRQEKKKIIMQLDFGRKKKGKNNAVAIYSFLF